MVEEEIDVEVLIPDLDTILAADEAEAVAEVEHELGDAIDEALLQRALFDLGPDVEEIEVVRAHERFVRLLGQILRQRRRKVVRFALRLRALEHARVDHCVEHVARPSVGGRGAEVEEALGVGAGLVEDRDVLAPGDEHEKGEDAVCGRWRGGIVGSRHDLVGQCFDSF